MNYIVTSKAPSAIGPYSQAIGLDNLIFTSGQIGLDNNGVLVKGGIKEQTTQVLANLSEVLKEANSSLSKVVKTTIFLADMNDFAEVNKIYAQFFGNHKPARSTVAVMTLPLNVKIEIDAIALRA
ncbi:MAG: RidA family protein [Campylobacteraceae bacterium]|nr:RidA family protein [Campylobacteraceae bacterium]